MNLQDFLWQQVRWLVVRYISLIRNVLTSFDGDSELQIATTYIYKSYPKGKSTFVLLSFRVTGKPCFHLSHRSNITR